eukprot:13684354-Ditylum_brightwellii.AAC.1
MRDHLLQCGSSECTKWYKTLLDHLHWQMKLLHTKPLLIELLIENLKNCFNDLPAECQNMPIDERRAVGKQTAIGWRRLFNGQLTKRWAILQDDHLHHIRL